MVQSIGEYHLTKRAQATDCFQKITMLYPAFNKTVMYCTKAAFVHRCVTMLTGHPAIDRTFLPTSYSHRTTFFYYWNLSSLSQSFAAHSDYSLSHSDTSHPRASFLILIYSVCRGVLPFPPKTRWAQNQIKLTCVWTTDPHHLL